MTTAPPADLTRDIPTDSETDLFADDVLADSQPVYARLRELAPVVHLERGDLWVITRYDDVRDALGDPEAFSSAQVAFNPVMNEMLVGTSLATDPPDHQRLRSVLTENLTPRAVRGMKAGMDEKAEALVRELAARGSFDAFGDLARDFVTSIVMDLIGIRGEVREKLLPWGAAALNMQGPLNDRTEQALPVAGELFHWTHEEISAVDLAEGSMGRAVFEAAERGEIAPESAGMIVHQYIAAGMDTTITAIANAMVLLGQHPEQFERIRQDHSLVPSAFAEVQRMLPPIPVVGRLVTRDVTVQGHRIPAGSQAALLVGAGNRDPRHYVDPETFDVTRNPTDHLAFGYGTHTCAGQGLARLEAHAVLTAVARNVTSFRVEDVQRRLHNITRPYEVIGVTVAERAD